MQANKGTIDEHMLTDAGIRRRIIRKLFRRGKWGAAYTSFESLKKGFNQRDTGKQGLKRVDKIGEALIRENPLYQNLLDMDYKLA